MKIYKSIFYIFVYILSTSVSLAVPFMTDDENCSNYYYKKSNPDKCLYEKNKNYALPIISGITILGGAMALMNMYNTDGKAPSIIETYYTPTLSAYDFVGNDIDLINLASVESLPEYKKNVNQYNDIRLSYSIARGYTGKGSTIAILDAGLNSVHGKSVTEIASGPIASNVNVNSYTISNDGNFLSYKEIGNVIASAHNANIYNASWSVEMKATNLRSKQQLIKLTDENFVRQLSAAASRDAIFVWAAGNDRNLQSSALSAIPNVIPEMLGHFVNVVAWDSQTEKLAEYSNQCGITKNWCITAPGTNIKVNDKTMTGTSFAAPIVSAAIAVIREAFPYMTANEITNLLFETARDLGEPGIDEVYGHGMLDLERATRPVGIPLIPIDGGTTMIPLQNARVSGALAHNISKTSPTFAFFDKYGRPFQTNISDIISIHNPGVGFNRLREQDDIKLTKLKNFEIGLTNSEVLFGDGFLNMQNPDWFGFISAENTLDIGKANIFQRISIKFGIPKIAENSFINSFSNIYTATLDTGINIGNWGFSVSIPNAVISGNMNMRLPINRDNKGMITYKDYEIDLKAKPAIEYSISYKNITASFIDNPYGTDEFFIISRGKINF